MRWHSSKTPRGEYLTGQRGFCLLLVCLVGISCAAEVRDVYLFDCGGMIGILGGDDLKPGPAVHVSEIDSTLPVRVRDGCAIRRGWYDSQEEQLLLEVQVQAKADAAGLVTTETITLSVPDLDLVNRAPYTTFSEQRVDSRDLVRKIPFLQSPFKSSAAYYVYGETTLVLQELEHDSADSGFIRPVVVRAPGAVELQQTIRGTAGRYAIHDLAADTQLGDVIAVAVGSDDDRVLCLTPDGLLLLAAARDSLLAVDTRGGRGTVVSEVSELDLYWTACAWSAPGTELRP